MAARCNLVEEDLLRAAGFSGIAGIDEAGRGPLAGPVVVAAVVLPLDFSHPRLDDSKKLSPKAREQIFEEITSDNRISWAVVEVGVEEIDRLNILRATHEGMRRVVRLLSVPVDHVLIDGLPVEPYPLPQKALVGGDGLCLSIAAASVCAKVIRDRKMQLIDAAFPQYGFAKHKGYGTALHMERLREYGPTPHHRRSFAPVQQMVLPL